MHRSLAAGLVALLLITACTSLDDHGLSEEISVPPSVAAGSLRAPVGAVGATVSFRPDITTLATAGGTPAFAAVGGLPKWVVGAPLADDRILWVVVDDLGTTTGVIDGDGVRTNVGMGKVSAAAAPAVVPGIDGIWGLATRESLAEFAPIAVLGDGRLAAVTDAGDLRLWDGGQPEATVAGPFLPDAEVVEVAPGVVAVLADPTDEYSHGVVGDRFEAQSVRIIDVTSGDDVTRIDVGDRVIEQRAPALVDVDTDGAADLVLTTSGPTDGARLEVYDQSGEAMAIGPAIGSANRWRHVVGPVQTLPGAIVEVVMPHATHTAQLVTLDGDSLTALDSVELAFASHSIGSRNLSMAAVLPLRTAADLVGPSPRRSALVARTVSADGLGEEVLLVNKEPTSNIAVVVSGSMWGAAVGFSDGSIAIWSGSTI